MKQICAEFYIRKEKPVIQEANTISPEEITPPGGAYGFRFLERTVVEHEGELLTGESKYTSPMYYFGILTTLGKVKVAQTGSGLGLGDESDGPIIVDKFGNFHGYDESDKVIEVVTFFNEKYKQDHPSNTK